MPGHGAWEGDKKESAYSIVRPKKRAVRGNWYMVLGANFWSRKWITHIHTHESALAKCLHSGQEASFSFRVESATANRIL